MAPVLKVIGVLGCGGAVFGAGYLVGKKKGKAEAEAEYEEDQYSEREIHVDVVPEEPADEADYIPGSLKHSDEETEYDDEYPGIKRVREKLEDEEHREYDAHIANYIHIGGDSGDTDEEVLDRVDEAIRNDKAPSMRDSIYELSERDVMTTFSDSEHMYLRYVKDSNELYDDRDEYIPHPRLFIGNVFDSLEGVSIWPVYVYNEDIETVYEIDAVDVI